MAVATPSVTELCLRAKRASRLLAQLDRGAKDAALHAIADALEARTPEILEANARDMEAGREPASATRCSTGCALDEDRIAAIAAQVRDIAALPDPVGEVVDGGRLANGLSLRRVRVPLGVIGVVYEARPNVTIDAAALCLKSGNAIVLRGSSSAAHSNAVLAARRRRGLGAARRGGDAALRRARRARRAGPPDRPRRPGHPARGRGAEEGARGGRHRAGHLRRVGQLPRLRRRLRGPRCRAADHRQRQDPAPRRLQRGRDAARPRRRRARFPARRAGRRCARRGSSCASTAARGAAVRRRRRRGHRRGLGHRVPRPRPGREGRRLARGGRSTTSTRTAPGTPRRS